jgi:Lipid A 3-O-deacylase (PagL)
LAMPIVIHPDNPPRTHVYSGIIWYQPPKWIWNNLNVYIAGRYGHWWSDGAQVNRMINIYSLAPVLRYYFFKKTYFSPYLEASIGVGCLSRTHFNTRNLGMHFTFQDELGIGVVAGKEAGFYATVSVLHYSNAHLSSHNSGITVPVMLTLGYQFN